MTLPAVALVITITLGAFAMQIERMKLVDVAASAARATARGDDELMVAGLVSEMLGEPSGSSNFRYQVETKEEFVCFKLTRQMQLPALDASLFELSEIQCARKMGL